MSIPSGDSEALARVHSARRRTFAIISHPDAGKTTLTENILLAGGAIRLAGEVKARGETRRTTSDWMKIERERGISVTASVMTFEFEGNVFNLLDTPGHEDFSEDTYRTLTAADSAIMVLDAAKGIEPRTLKLFEVCRLRDIPIITFVNKMDREALDPLELIDEVQSKLQLDVAPLMWPASSGQSFRGCVDLRAQDFLVFRKPAHDDSTSIQETRVALDDAEFANLMSASERAEFEEGAGLARDGLPAFDLGSYREGHLTPMLFGSALRRYGVRELIRLIGEIAPPPRPQKAEAAGKPIVLSGAEKEVSGFVFKIQANMDPNHRDRIAFVRLASGRFARGMRLRTPTGRQINIHNPLMFMAQDREIAEEAYAGDVIGVPNYGVLRVGDSLSESGVIRFQGIPNFAPEILRRVRVRDPLKAKHLRRALEGLAEEGVTQLFKPALGADLIVGAVGPLQFEVMSDRMANEYNLEVLFEPAPFASARWLSGERADLEAFAEKNRSAMAGDVDDAPVFLAKNSWEISYTMEKNPKIRFSAVKERH